jgi:prolyl-tRNA editing enzyme YbaK/EbsC (Cys-tRNA(Pro) deacylase)
MMAIEKVREYFRQYGMENRIQEFPVSSATVDLAAEALHTQGCRIAKTMSFDVSGRTVLIVTAGDMKIDNHKYKEEFAKKAEMLSPDDVLARIGHAVGGVCPFGIPSDVEVYLDVSLKRFQTVFPACGSSNSAIELSIPELEKYSNSRKWIDVCRSREVQA